MRERTNIAEERTPATRRRRVAGLVSWVLIGTGSLDGIENIVAFSRLLWLWSNGNILCQAGRSEGVSIKAPCAKLAED